MAGGSQIRKRANKLSMKALRRRIEAAEVRLEILNVVLEFRTGKVRNFIRVDKSG